jgi:hypothetical protein
MSRGLGQIEQEILALIEEEGEDRPYAAEELANETSAFNKIRAFSTRRAGLFPFRINVSSRSRSSPLSLTTYFFTEISFAAMIASPRQSLATKSNH